MTLAMVDLGWAAGFLEGEGWFGEGRSPKMSAAQNEIEPLLRLQRLFGGKIVSRKTKGFSRNSINVWTLDAYKSPGVMMTIYSLMSPRRQAKISSVLSVWRHARRLRQRGATVCIHGHDLTLLNALSHHACRACKNEQKRRRRACSSVGR